MPATCLADHDFLATPGGRHRARGNTSCYWRQLSLDTRGEVKRPCPLQAGRTAMAVGQAPLNARPQQPTAGTMGARPTRTLGLAQASRCPRPLENISVVYSCFEPFRDPPKQARRGDADAYMASHPAAREGTLQLWSPAIPRRCADASACPRRSRAALVDILYYVNHFL